MYIHTHTKQITFPQKIADPFAHDKKGSQNQATNLHTTGRLSHQVDPSGDCQIILIVGDVNRAIARGWTLSLLEFSGWTWSVPALSETSFHDIYPYHPADAHF